MHHPNFSKTWRLKPNIFSIAVAGSYADDSPLGKRRPRQTDHTGQVMMLMMRLKPEFRQTMFDELKSGVLGVAFTKQQPGNFVGNIVFRL